MRVLVAGATGVVGSRVVRRLVAAGHEVVGTTRREDRLGFLAEDGAQGVVMDALDGPATAEVVRRCAPDVVVHELTDLSGLDFSANAELRVTGTRHLVDACRSAGVDAMVAQSISWAYVPGSTPADEDEPLDLDGSAGSPRYASVDSLERSVRSLRRGTVLRYGIFYGPGTWYGAGGRSEADAASGLITATTAWTSFVHVDDAADATVLALTWPAGTYNVVDDVPTHVDEWGPRYVAALGATVRAIRTLGEGRAASNRRARALGWVPAHPDWRQSLT